MDRKCCSPSVLLDNFQNLIKVLHYQEYERAVIFRLGRLVSGGAKGPGVFFVIPCLDVYEKIDMRTATYDVPPQEVRTGQGYSGDKIAKC